MPRTTVAVATVAAGLALAGGEQRLVRDDRSACDPSVAQTLSPGASIANAVRDAPSCAAIKLQAGTYPAVQLADGLAKERVIVRPVAGAAVTIAGGFVSGRAGGSVTFPTGSKGIELWGIAVQGPVTMRWGSDNFRLQSITATNLRIQSSSNWLVDDSSFGPTVNDVATINNGGTGSPGVFDGTISNSLFHDYTISDPAKHSECMQIWPSAPSARLKIIDTYFRNCTDFNVLVKAANLSDVEFIRVSADTPMPGNEATVLCNPNCPRGGSSIRFSTHQYPGAKVLDSKLGGGLAIDQAGFVEVASTCTNCDPGAVPLIPSGASPPPPPPTETEPPPMTTYADDFERASLGANWQNVSGASAGIINGDLGIVSGVFLVLRWAGGSSPPDQFSEAVVSGGMSSTALARAVWVRRRASDGARYQFHYDSNGTGSDTRPQWQLKFDGVPTAQARILAADVVRAPPDPGDEIEIRVRGSEIQGLLNDQVILTATDTALSGGDIGVAALGIGGVSVSNQPAFSRWAGGALTSSPPPPPPADSLPLSIVAQNASTVTLGWTPVPGIGYRFLVDGKIVSHTWDQNRSQVRFAKAPGAALRVEALAPGPFGSVVSP